MKIRLNIIYLIFPFLLYGQLDFHLEDLNYNSNTFQDIIGPSSFPNNVRVIYFGHEYWGACQNRFGFLNNIYLDLVSEEIYDVTFIGVGKDQYYQDIGDMIDGNVISWVEDSQNDNYPVWSSWNAYQRAIYFLNRDGSVDTTFNFTPYNENQGNYDIIFNLIMELRGYNNNSIEIEYFSGWNMVGLPIIVNDNNYQYLFPTSVSGSLYSFSGSYTQENTLDVGQGYWIRLSDIAINNFSSYRIIPMLK